MNWLIETLVATTALMLVVLLIRRPVATIFGARAAYALWLLPALRAITPPLPEAIGPVPLAQLPILIEFESVAAVAPAIPAFEWGTLFLALWLAGAGVMIAWQLLAYHRFVSTALRAADDLPELDMGQIEVCASPLVEGPFAAGILVPRVVLPRDWRRRYTSDELRLALRHEAVHHSRGDLSINLIALAMLALHWFNPIAWFAWRAFRADQELACDAAVLDGATTSERHSYGSALVKSACPRTPVAACSLNPRDQLKQRLRMMRAAPDRRVAGRALAAVLTVSGLALTASGGIAAETTSEITREIEREVHAKVIAPAAAAVAAVAPAPPLAPAAPEPARPADAPFPPEAPQAPAAPDADTVVINVDEVMRHAADAVADGVEAPEPPAPPRRVIFSRRHGDDGVAFAPGAFASAGTALAKCNGAAHTADNTIVTTGPDGRHHRMRVVACGHGPSEADIRKLTLNALKQARHAIAENPGFDRKHLAEALAGIDAELAQLRAMKPIDREK